MSGIESIVEAIKSRNAIVFCGAGTSLNSGLPLVYGVGPDGPDQNQGLVNVLLKRLSADSALIQRVQRLRVPLEAIMANVDAFADIAGLVGIFDERRTSSFHELVASLVTARYVSTIVTTNFDCLIETALEQASLARDVDFVVHHRPESFSTIDLKSARPKVIKLHGCVRDPESVKVTLPRVLGTEFSKDVYAIVRRLFALGSNTSVLIFGYSCSDAFDVNPAIALAANDDPVNVILVEHTMAATFRHEPIADRPPPQPFVGYRRGQRLLANTDTLIAGMWRALFDADRALQIRPPSWREPLEVWTRAIVASGVGDVVLAGIYSDIARHQDALHLLEKNVPSEPLERVDRRSRIAAAQHELAQYETCVETCRQTLSELASLSLPRKRTWRREMGLLNTKARALQALGRHGAAEESYGEALALCTKNGAQMQTAFIRQNLGAIAFDRGAYARSKDHMQYAIQVSERTGEIDPLINAVEGLGSCYTMLHDFDAAIRQYQRALDLARATGRAQEQAQVLGNIAELEIERGRLVEAEEAIDEGLELGLAGHVADISLRLSGTRLALARQDLGYAVELCSEALTASERAGAPELTQRALAHLGSIALLRDEVAEAIDHFQRALRVATELQSPYGVMFCLDRLGTAQGVGRQFDASIQTFRRLLRLGLQRRDPVWVAAALRGIAATRFVSGKILRSLVLVPLLLAIMGAVMIARGIRSVVAR